MQGDFHLIELYRNLIQGSAEDETMFNSDQEVPQNTVNDDMTGVDIKTEPMLVPCDFQGSILEEVNPATFPAPSVGLTTATRVPDQQLNGGSSPSQFIDLDLYPGSDLTLYPIAPEAKPIQSQPIDDVLQQEENVEEDILYFLATKDIPEDCVKLEINPDPSTWTVDQVQRWVRCMCVKYSVPHVNLEHFRMDGTTLCLLSQDDFNQRHGEHLYALLQIWTQYSRVEEFSDQSAMYLDRSPAMVDCPSFDVSRQCTSPYSLSPSSPDESSMDSIPPTSEPSPTRRQPIDELMFSCKIESEDVSPRPVEHKQTIKLWQFLKELLHKPESFSGCIKWLDRSRGIFKIEDSNRVAKEWGRAKNRPAMNYDKLSRSIRQYYKKGIIKKTEHSKRLVYQFCVPYL